MNLYGRSLFNRYYYIMHWIECVARVIILDRMDSQKPLLFSKNNGQHVMMESEVHGKSTKLVKMVKFLLEFVGAGADFDKK